MDNGVSNLKQKILLYIFIVILFKRKKKKKKISWRKYEIYLLVVKSNKSSRRTIELKRRTRQVTVKQWLRLE